MLPLKAVLVFLFMRIFPSWECAVVYVSCRKAEQCKEVPKSKLASVYFYLNDEISSSLDYAELVHSYDVVNIESLRNDIGWVASFVPVFFLYDFFLYLSFCTRACISVAAWEKPSRGEILTFSSVVLKTERCLTFPRFWTRSELVYSKSLKKKKKEVEKPAFKDFVPTVA